jgi:hypothetical protein
MTVSEYEERFRISSPSLHETFVAMQGSDPRRWRRQRFLAISIFTYVFETNRQVIETVCQ